MSLLHRDPVRDYLSQRVFCRTETAEPVVALTYDDGPNPHNTPPLLDMLAEFNVPATFFLVGSRAQRFPEIVERIVSEGHELGNHTQSHSPLTLLPGWVVRRELENASRHIEAASGVRPRWVRPPFGWFNPRTLGLIRNCGYVPVIGTVYPRDPRCPGTDVIVSRVMSRVGPGDVIILHDGGWRLRCNRTQTIAATRIVIEELLQRGYRFATLTDMGAHDVI